MEDEPRSQYLVWTHEEAVLKQVTQVASSGCGATAVATVLSQLVGRALLPELDTIVQGCVLRTRKNDAALPEYLASRSIAGCTGAEIVSSAVGLFPRLIAGAFVEYSRMKHLMAKDGGAGLVEWIAAQLREGKCLVATLNLQAIGNDAWHHQFIYGTDTHRRLVFCTNPIVAYTEAEFISYISTPSTLLVRRADVVLRHREGEEDALYDQPLWSEYRVREQVARALTDSTVSHVAIPASYVGGVAVLARTDAGAVDQ